MLNRLPGMSINAGYFRYPTIAGDTIVFVSEDDLWAVPAEGGGPRGSRPV